MEDSVSHTREWRGVVEEDTFRTIADSELAPESGQVYLDWGRTPRFVKVFKHRRPCFLICDGKYPLNRPFAFDRTVGVNNGSKSILEPEEVLRLLTDSNVCNHAEERTTPISASPGVRIVDASIQAPRLPVWHPVYHSPPHLLLGKKSSLKAGYRLNVGRDTFLKPMLIVGE